MRTSHILRFCRALLLRGGDNRHHPSNPDVYLVFGICGSACYARNLCSVASPSHPVVYHTKIPSLHRWSLMISLPYSIAYAVTYNIIMVITIFLPSIRETYFLCTGMQQGDALHEIYQTLSIMRNEILDLGLKCEVDPPLIGT